MISEESHGSIKMYVENAASHHRKNTFLSNIVVVIIVDGLIYITSVHS